MEKQNKIFLNPAGYIEMVIIGDQTYDTFHEMLDKLPELLEQLEGQGKPLRGLIDLTQKGKYTPGSNKAAMEALEQVPYQRVAMFGADAVLKEVTEMIILAMGKKEKTQLFHDRESAVAWLMREEPAAQVDAQ
jgi:hypothetical protein